MDLFLNRAFTKNIINNSDGVIRSKEKKEERTDSIWSHFVYVNTTYYEKCKSLLGVIHLRFLYP